ncbi:MAG: hypothetical protein F6K54_14580 [Okeania sp. SIO3B5]|uniref:hypothetical protein n=1 Tax=Okeania sp. SIO3B5 TaxID=2607811 RepID=UPI0014009CE5|nr:hypothetical protein [Okeania sp. SIO3B5]NEO54199.1 hypothetical protein [Okeania sp. SIO3B5]
MTRTPHDQFAKQYLEELLTLLGQVETSRDVASEVREIDVYFIPEVPPPKDPKILGLLGQMAATASIYEPFRNPPQQLEILDCQAKLNFVINQQKRKAKRENTSYSQTEWPFLWILCPSCSDKLIEGFGAKLDPSGKWPTGVYFLAEFLNTALVAINQLPINQDTLSLRVLGKGKTQEQAILELKALPEGNPLRENLMELLASWYVTIQFRENISEEDREVFMRLSPVYVQWREETLEQGRQEGVQQGEQRIKQQMIENFLNARFGSLEPELLAIIEPMLQLSAEELTSLLLNASREELLERFGK